MKKVNKNNTKKIFHYVKYVFGIVFVFLWIAIIFCSFLSVNGNFINRNSFSYSKNLKMNYDKQNNIIIQNAEEQDEWAQRFKKDLNKYSINNKNSMVSVGNIDYHTKNPNGATSWLMFDVSGEIGWSAPGRFSGSVSGTTYLDAIEIKLFASNNKNIVQTLNSATTSGGSQHGWSGFSTDKKWKKTLWVNIPSGYSINDVVNSFAIRIKSHFKGDDVDNWIRLSKIIISGGGSIIYSSPNLWNLGNLGATTETPNYSKSHSYSFNDVNIGQTDYINKKQIKAKKIFMSENNFKNKSFSRQELKSFIHLYDGNKPILPSKIHFNNIILNKQLKKLEITISKIDDGDPNHYYGAKTFSIPINLVNFNYLLEGSIKSDSYWKHNPNGTTEYHALKPKTKLRLSENYLKSLYIFTGQEEMYENLAKEKWLSKSEITLFKSKIDSFALNISNFNQIIQAFKNSRDTNIINNLQENHSLDKYKNLFENKKFSDFLHVLKDSKISVDYGIKTFAKKEISFNKIWEGIYIDIDDSELKNLDKNRINWSMHVKNLKIIQNNFNYYLDNILKIDIPKDQFQNYDLDLKYKDIGEYEILHSYLYQTHGIDVSDNVSFIMEDGTVLNQDFKVIRASREGSLKVNDFGYVSIRYLATISKNQKKYLTLIKKQDQWFSSKYNKFITQIDPTFNSNKVEYLFNKDLQLIINPYTKSSGQPVTATTSQKFGIKRVWDENNNTIRVLEDWNDGRWSHTHDINGIAKFDGIFGSDINGILDYSGRLSEGSHHIGIELQNSSFTGLKNNFNIVIDKSPVDIQVDGTDFPLKKSIITTNDGEDEEMYFSNGPINLKIEDKDIKSIEAKFIDHLGHWYQLPIPIQSKKVNGIWKQVINSTIDYAGFVEVKILDQADNKRKLYFWLKQKNKAEPDLIFDKKLLYDGVNAPKFRGNKFSIFNSKPEIILSSPLVENIKLTKFDYDNHKWVNSNKTNEYTISDYLPSTSDSYAFAKTIDSQQSVLKYAGDELKPFISSTNDKNWNVMNKILRFNSNGLFKIELKTNFLENKLITQYIYIKNNNMEIIDFKNGTNDETNFDELPLYNEGEKKNIDSLHKLLSKIDVSIPQFLIKDYYVEYSLPWYSNFTKLVSPEFSFGKDGKYKIHILDMYGVNHDYQILLINKKMSLLERKQKGYSQVYRKNNDENTAFWKGKVIWNFGRYEDEDHVIWERDKFVKKAIEDGLTKDEAEALYKYLKENPGWDGNTDGIKEKWLIFNKKESQVINKQNQFKKASNLSKGSVVGIVIGTTLLTIFVGITIIWLVKKRILSKRLK